MFSALLTFVIVVPSAAICMFPMKNQLRHGLRRTLMEMGVLFLVLIPAAAWTAYHFLPTPRLLLIPILAGLFFVYHRSLRVHISKSLAVFCSVLALMSILAMLRHLF